MAYQIRHIYKTKMYISYVNNGNKNYNIKDNNYDYNNNNNKITYFI